VPTYDLATSRALGRRDLTAAPQTRIIAEGVFAAEIIPDLRAAGLLASAYCVGHPRWVTFALRLARDLRERRKPPLVLLRRGIVLWRREPAVVARAVASGAVCRSPRAVERELG
jgi:uridine kinase